MQTRQGHVTAAFGVQTVGIRAVSRVLDVQGRGRQPVAAEGVNRPTGRIADGQARDLDIVRPRQKQRARAAGVTAGGFGPRPPIAPVATTINHAPARQDQAVAVDGCNRRGKGGFWQAFPTGQRAACVVARWQDRPVGPIAMGVQLGPFGQIERYARFQKNRPDGVAARRNAQGAAFGRGINRALDRGGVVGGAGIGPEVARIHQTGAFQRAETQTPQRRGQAIFGIRRQVFEKQRGHSGLARRAGFVPTAKLPADRNRHGIACAARGQQKTCCPRRQLENAKIAHRQTIVRKGGASAG